VYRIRDTVTGKEKVVHRNLLLPVDFLTFPGQEGNLASLEESQSDNCCAGAQSSVEVADKEDSQTRTMNWLMQSPVLAEVESESVSEEDVVEKALSADASGDDQSDIQQDIVLEDSVSDQITHEHTDKSPDLVYDIAHLPVDRSVALSDTSHLVEVRPDQVVCAHPPNTQAPSVVTRCGRRVRNPNRLICEMSGQRLLGNTEPILGSAFSFIAVSMGV